MPQINLLPPDIRTRQRARRILFGLVAAGLVILLFLGVVLFIQRNTISNEEDELADLQAEAAQLRSQVAALQEFGQLKASIDQKRGTLQTALENDVDWPKFLNDLALIIPDDSWLVSLQLTAAAGQQAPSGEPSFGNVSFQGFVFDFPGLAGWLTRTAQVDGLTFVYLTTGTKQEIGSTEVVSFGASASLTESLLSRRCQEDEPCP